MNIRHLSGCLHPLRLLCLWHLKFVFEPSVCRQGAQATFFFCLFVVAASLTGNAAPETVDVVVYGGTASGVVSAVQAARMGRSVLLVEPWGVRGDTPLFGGAVGTHHF